MDRGVREGDWVTLGGLEAQVIEVPAHTAGHIAYHLPEEGAIFVGDTLFAMGCGRLFEGDAAQMHANLQRLASLPPETRVYCAHEYTLSNGRFALTVEPDNPDLRRRMAEVEAARAAGEATVPTTIALERATNPFMRASSVEAFAERRLGKDNFRG
jgi:hydroxyacylglutathione hydrolase